MIQGDQTQAAAALEKVDQAQLEEGAKSLYTHINQQVKTVLFQQYYLNGGNYIMSQEYDKAIEELTKAVKADPDQYDGYYLLGMAYYYKGDTANANKTFQNAIKKFPDRAAELEQFISGDMSNADINVTQNGTEPLGATDPVTDPVTTDPMTADPNNIQYDEYGNIIG